MSTIGPVRHLHWGLREEVPDHCRRWLPGYMVPDIVELREGLPTTSTGKVDRAGLAREQPELQSAG